MSKNYRKYCEKICSGEFRPGLCVKLCVDSWSNDFLTQLNYCRDLSQECKNYYDAHKICTHIYQYRYKTEYDP